MSLYLLKVYLDKGTKFDAGRVLNFKPPTMTDTRLSDNDFFVEPDITNDAYGPKLSLETKPKPGSKLNPFESYNMEVLLDNNQFKFYSIGPFDPNNKKIVDLTESADGLSVNDRESMVILRLFHVMIALLGNPRVFNAPEDQARMKMLVEQRHEQYKRRLSDYLQSTFGRFKAAGKSMRIV